VNVSKSKSREQFYGGEAAGHYFGEHEGRGGADRTKALNPSLNLESCSSLSLSHSQVQSHSNIQMQFPDDPGDGRRQHEGVRQGRVRDGARSGAAESGSGAHLYY